MAVAQLYYHLAPTNETVVISRALIRLLRGPREVQLVVLNNIATVSAKRRVQFLISKVNTHFTLGIKIVGLRLCLLS